MVKPRNLLFVLTDGGRARLVRRSPTTGDFVTLEEVDQMRSLRRLRAELRASPPARVFTSFSPSRSSVGREDYFRPAKEAFVAEVADRAAAVIRRQRFDGVFLAAPPRLIGPLRRRFGRRSLVAGTLGKDLTKAPDHELRNWLAGAGYGLRESA